MINRNKLEHILEYAKQQRHIGQYCKVPPEDMVEIMERLLNAGNSPVIPDGYVMVPVEPNGDMLAAAQDAYGETDGDIASTLRATMLAAAPQLPGSDPATMPGKWIPVSERMPERGDWLVTDGCDFDVQLFNGEQFIPGFVWEDKITHWMPLPAAPQEVKGE
ncbi:DUF551 domain-containing protein [Klebsiella quasipneumoniae subsp. quasipneumoniae]|nr:DUF551 domain-containing protein [Klebsiella pneumoniae]UWA83766.1 DUF551 domain-containing protein [Klebsiella quasipneumoniae subsp. quasipneumoniae]SAV54609.1 Eaa1 [Klebsiella pneumoniae]